MTIHASEGAVQKTNSEQSATSNHTAAVSNPGSPKVTHICTKANTVMEIEARGGAPLPVRQRTLQLPTPKNIGQAIRNSINSIGSTRNSHRASGFGGISSKSRLSLEALPMETPLCTRLLILVVNSKPFSICCLLAILTNTVLIAVHTDVTLQDEIEYFRSDTKFGNSIWYEVTEGCFCAYFTTELAMRYVAADRGEFLRGPDWKWNYFDVGLVCFSVLKFKSLSFVRLIRIVRLARVFRVIRVMRFFRSLRLMVHSIFISITDLLWVFALLFVIGYMWSIFIGIMVTLHFIDAKDQEETNSHRFLITEFGSVLSIMVTLFMSISGGRDWREFYSPLLNMNTLAGVAFLIYIFFVVFGVLNVVTGAFVDSMRQVSQRDNDLVIEEELKKVNEFKSEIRLIFEEADVDGSGTLSWDEFESHLQDERVRAYFASLQLDIAEARALFVLLDVEETDEVPIEKFINGCLRMRGDAKSIDVNMILYENEKMLCKLTSFTDYAEEKFEGIEHGLRLARSQLNMMEHEHHSEEAIRTAMDRRKSIAVPRRSRVDGQYASEASRTRRRSTATARAPEKASSRLDAALKCVETCERAETPDSDDTQGGGHRFSNGSSGHRKLIHAKTVGNLSANFSNDFDDDDI